MDPHVAVFHLCNGPESRIGCDARKHSHSHFFMFFFYFPFNLFGFLLFPCFAASASLPPPSDLFFGPVCFPVSRAECVLFSSFH